MRYKGKEGKDIIFLTGFALTVIGYICLAIAFVTPYWVISWPRVFSEFKRIGLWEACFAGLVIDMDPTQKAYHGCWWILAKEFWSIRDWLMPPWFVTIQVVVTFCFICEFAALVIQGILYSRSRASDATGYSRKLPPFNLVQATTYITIIMAIVKLFVVLIFFACLYTDKNWMPRPDLNYPSWSFGLFVMSVFFSTFASIAHVIYNRIIRREYREAPTGGGSSHVPLNRGTSPAPPSVSSVSTKSRPY